MEGIIVKHIRNAVFFASYMRRIDIIFNTYKML